MARISIRAATITDAPALAACIEAAYAVYKDRIPDLPEVSEGIAQDMEENLVLVAIGDVGLLGGIILLEKTDLFCSPMLPSTRQPAGRVWAGG